MQEMMYHPWDLKLTLGEVGHVGGPDHVITHRETPAVLPAFQQ